MHIIILKRIFVRVFMIKVWLLGLVSKYLQGLFACNSDY